PTVYALNIDQSGNIWVGGQFTTAGSINANNIAEWIPTGTGTGTWYGLGSGTTTTTQGVLTEAYGNASGYYQQFSEAPGVFSIVSNGSTIYVGGDFASVNGTGTSVAYNLAQWTVSGAGTGTWSYVGTASNHQGVQGPSFDGAEVNALYYSSPFLYIGGDFQDVNNSALEVNNAAMWSGATFAEMPTGSTPGFDPAFFTAYAIAGLAGVGPNDAGVLYMGGYNTPNPYTASMTEVNSIVQWGDPDVILPIKILTFNAQYNPDGNVVNLNWETATEVNNKEFTIEKTLDGTNWAFVANIKGSGTSSIPISYTSIDEQPYSGTSYYRLKQTDYDGNFTYSELRPVTIGIQQNKVEVIPNPARNYTNIIFGTSEPGDAVLALYDCTGRLIYSRQIITVKGVNSAELEISNYTNGVYFVTLTSELQNYTDKLIISH
ncbi:MAG TPA: T9SS type A sorting domain-containing protein, partial [Bacteroidia bacterium]|nr:T9SS type A sorting domain-containing protein [Bacteroidia bacterium]